MSIQQFFNILWVRKGIVLAALLSCLAAAALTAELLPERYTGRARLMLEVIKPDPVTGQVLGGNRMLGAYVKTQVELIKDYQVAEPTVDKLGWASEPNLVAAYEQSGAAPNEDIRHWLARELIRNTDANLIENSNILEITYQAANPEAAKRIAQVLRDTYVEVNQQYQRDQAGKTADWYQQQADQAAALVKSAEEERAAYAKRVGVVLDANNMDLEGARLQALSQQSAATVGVKAPPVVRTGPTIGPAQAQLEGINQQIAQAATTLGPNHPTFQALQRQKAAIEAIARRERSSGGTVSGGGGISTAAVNAEYERQKAKVIARTPEVERIQSMTRDIEQKRVQLAKIQDRAADQRLAANADDSVLTPMGDATSGDSPDFPNRPLIWAAAIGFGLFLGIALALLIELLGRRVRTASDVEQITGAPVLAEIRLDPSDRRRLRLPFGGARQAALPAPEAA